MEGTLLVPPKSRGQQPKLWQAVCSVLDVLEPHILGCMFYVFSRFVYYARVLD
jgi:hypothetical protein